jgi:hypothetical protein
MNIVACIGVAIVTSGCATLFGSKTADISMTSEPTAAEVYIEGERVGVTPMSMNMDNTESVAVTFKKEGYKDMTCMLTKKTGGGWVVLDILAGLVGIIIDAATGDWSQLPEHACHGVLPTQEAGS